MKWINKILSILEKFATGCIESTEDSRDHIFRDNGKEKAFVDLEPHIPKVLYQGSAPSCVANAVSHAISIEEKMGRLRKSTPSRRWIYYYARKQHSAVSTPLTGTSIRYALKSIRRFGCPPESRCKYSTRASKLNRKPTGKMAQYASSRMGMKYEWIGRSGRTKNIRLALSAGHPVIFGTRVGSSLKKYKEGQVLSVPSSHDGGHAMAIIGYREGKNGWEYKILNSWRGKEIVWMKEEYITWSKSHDFAIVTGWR